MGNCRYCGEDAGFLRRQHPVCRLRREAGLGMMAIIARAVSDPGLDEADVRSRLAGIAERSLCDDGDVAEVLDTAWSERLGPAAADVVVSPDK